MTKNWPYTDYSKVDPEVERNFPFPKARESQLECISEIKQAIDKGYRYIVLEAGTGTGKSAMAATLASMYDSTYILTVTKQLQDQYLNDFKKRGFRLVKGRNNFKCRKYLDEGIDLNCDEGRCVVEGYKCKYSLKGHTDAITEENTCHYFYQKYLAMYSDVVISNYPYMFLELNYVDDFTDRALMVCDEAHNLETTIMNLLKLEFKRKDLKEYLKIDLSEETVEMLDAGDYKTWIGFIQRVRERYAEELDNIENIKNRPELNEKISFMKKAISDCDRFISHIIMDPHIWIFDHDKENNAIEFKPLRVSSYAKDTLFDYADVCLFMSATILDYRLFAYWLGISEDEIYAIRQKSPFDVKRNPIKTYDDFNLSHNHIDENAPKTIDTIKLILEKHRNDKGIIHTISNRCMNFIKDNIKDSRFVFHNTKNRAEQLEKFKASDEPLVLVSPSMNEGVDLPGNLCRFQIIYKIPYPDLGDKQTRIRSDMDSVWYEYKTSLALVQTYGRGMRFEEDYCRTYFIDNRLKGYVRRDMSTYGFLSDSFIDAIDSLPAMVEDENAERDFFYDETHKEKIERKCRLFTRANQFLEEEKYEAAIGFYNALLDNELFANDYYPYLKLSKAYHGAELYEMEAEIIIRFFKSGIYCRNSKLDWFKERLADLSKRGYFDLSRMDELEAYFKRHGALNEVLSNQPVPTVFNIKKNMRNMKKASSLRYPPECFDSICQMDEGLSYDEMVSFKYKLYDYGNRLIKGRKFDKAIGFYTRLLTHELFANDYHPYRKLATVYRRNGQYGDAVNILIEFYRSGIYCNPKQFKWFNRQLEELSRYGNFDYDEMDVLKDEFVRNGARNKSKSNKPVPIAAKLKKLNQTKRRQSNSNDYMKDFFKSMKS